MMRTEITASTAMLLDRRPTLKLDSRYWGFVPRQNIVGRPMVNYWSFKSMESQLQRFEEVLIWKYALGCYRQCLLLHQLHLADL
jgi:hypothetical protein